MQYSEPKSCNVFLSVTMINPRLWLELSLEKCVCQASDEVGHLVLE